MWIMILIIIFSPIVAFELDTSDYDAIISFDKILDSMKLSIINNKSISSLSIPYANLASMYYQRNLLWRQGGRTESLHYTNLALLHLESRNVSSAKEKRFHRNLLLHKATVLADLGRRYAALHLFDQLIENGASISSYELSKFQFKKAELTLSLFDNYTYAAELHNQSLSSDGCNYQSHLQLVSALKAVKNDTVSYSTWIKVIHKMELYLSNLHVISRKDKYGFKSEDNGKLVLLNRVYSYNNTKSSRKHKQKIEILCYFGDNDIYPGQPVSLLDALRDIVTLSGVRASLSWALHIAAEAAAAAALSLGITTECVSAKEYSERSHLGTCYNSSGNNLPPTQLVAHQHYQQSWKYLQLARHFDRLRISEQYYQSNHQLQRHATSTTSSSTADNKRGNNGNKIDNIRNNSKNLFGMNMRAGATSSDATTNGPAAVNAGSSDDDDDRSGRIAAAASLADSLQRMKEAEQTALEYSAAQTKHVVSFFQKGYWTEPTTASNNNDDDGYNDNRIKNNDKRRKNKSFPADDGVYGGIGSKTKIPIFIVGFFRSGSTLLEGLLEKYTRIGNDRYSKSAKISAMINNNNNINESSSSPSSSIWGMGEESVLVFELFAMQQDVLRLYTIYEQNKQNYQKQHQQQLKEVSETDSRKKKKEGRKRSPSHTTNTSSHRNSTNKESELERELDERFVADYKKIIEKRATIVIQKMLVKYAQHHELSEENVLDQYGYNNINISNTNNNNDNITTPVVMQEQRSQPHKSRSSPHHTLSSPSSHRPLLRIVDKMLTNYINIGLIHLLFPRAIILHTIRDPMDTLLSCYMTRFGDPYVANTALHMHSLVQRYAQYLEVMQHFRNVLPYYTLPQQQQQQPSNDSSNKNIFNHDDDSKEQCGDSTAIVTQALVDVRYEELVANPDGVMQRILCILGIPMSPSSFAAYNNNTTVVNNSSRVNNTGVEQMLEAGVVNNNNSLQQMPSPNLFYHADTDAAVVPAIRVVNTASRLQVKQPIYSHSVGRWTARYSNSSSRNSSSNDFILLGHLQETLIPALKAHLPRLAALGALPYLNPNSSSWMLTLLKQPRRQQKVTQSLTGKSQVKMKQLEEKHAKKRKQSFDCSKGFDNEVVYMNWDLSEHFNYTDMIMRLASN